MKLVGYFSENVKHETFPEKKLLTEKSETAIKWIFQCSSSLAPPALPPRALSNQPAKPSYLGESFCVPGKWRTGAKETRPHVYPRAEY